MFWRDLSGYPTSHKRSTGLLKCFAEIPNGKLILDKVETCYFKHMKYMYMIGSMSVKQRYFVGTTNHMLQFNE